MSGFRRAKEHNSSNVFMQSLQTLFSERELKFTFAICCHPFVCRLSVCNARAPYSTGWNFQQHFYAIRYLSHPLTST